MYESEMIVDIINALLGTSKHNIRKTWIELIYNRGLYKGPCPDISDINWEFYADEKRYACEVISELLLL
jgi:hypothetical protein